MSSTVVLYDYWRSSASYRVRLALNIANISYKTIPIDLSVNEQKNPTHLSRNPQGYVPVLDIDGHRLTQSLAIIEYLEGTRSLDLLPREPEIRAKVRAMAYSIAIDIHPICNLSVAKFAQGIAKKKETTKKWMNHFIPLGLAAFEELLGTFDQMPFSTGEKISIVDICLVPQVYNALRWDKNYSLGKRTKNVYLACKALPAFVAAHPDVVKPK